MKKFIFLSIVALMSFVTLNGQILTHVDPSPVITDENAFMDASVKYSGEESKGKGLIFPTVDLTVFEFLLDNYAAVETPFHFFDGMLVYNNTAGETRRGGNNPSESFTVVPGFYYFSNPKGIDNQSVEEGEWVAFGTGGDDGSNGLKVNVLTGNERDALPSGASPTEKQELTGTVIYNTDSSQLEIWLGESWLALNKSEENEENETNGYLSYPDAALPGKYRIIENIMTWEQCQNTGGVIPSGQELTLLTTKPEFGSDEWWGGNRTHDTATIYREGFASHKDKLFKARCVRK